MPWSLGIQKKTFNGIEVEYQWTEQWEVTTYKWGLTGVGSGELSAVTDLFTKRIKQLEEEIKWEKEQVRLLGISIDMGC